MTLDYSGNLRIRGVLQANFMTINIENTSVNAVNNAVLYCIQGTFTRFHRVFTEDENFNIDDPQKFKDDYEE